MDFKIKYLKYKKKYINLLKQRGGVEIPDEWGMNSQTHTRYLPDDIPLALVVTNGSCDKKLNTGTLFIVNSVELIEMYGNYDNPDDKFNVIYKVHNPKTTDENNMTITYYSQVERGRGLINQGVRYKWIFRVDKTMMLFNRSDMKLEHPWTAARTIPEFKYFKSIKDIDILLPLDKEDITTGLEKISNNNNKIGYISDVELIDINHNHPLIVNDKGIEYKINQWTDPKNTDWKELFIKQNPDLYEDKSVFKMSIKPNKKIKGGLNELRKYLVENISEGKSLNDLVEITIVPK
uniref:Uncharacterized protein n=1 Tax=Megaviridae environmental sample TaxID=1737588 RepID=A0A5J6VKY4_9VIRU|nr:MAG: hypothetical protein [Megaviridae environmental sample]